MLHPYSIYMKSLLLILSLWGIAITSSFSQTTEADIQDIREKYAYITQNINSMRVVQINIECPTYPESGALTFYYEGERLRLVVHDYSDGGHGGGENQYFVWDGQMFFYYANGGYWTFAQSEGDTPVTVDHVEEYRYYYKEKIPIRYLEKRYSCKSTDKNQKTSAQVPNEEGSYGAAEEALEEFQKMLLFESKTHLSGTCIWESKN
ncbi:MAG: hypothetical protein AAFS00_04595 [Bacteroidota bacterium]